MVSPHLLKLRIRRFWRRRLVRTAKLVQGTGELIETSGFARFYHLRAVWKFMTLWILACAAVLAGLVVQFASLKVYYQVYGPVPGGRFTEGEAGSFSTANPLFAISDVDTSVSRLLFSGLLRYDDNNQLVGDLAESWSVDPSGRIYTVRLRPNLTWHDGQPVTADDVVYTYNTIQNPDANSPLFASWQGVKVEAIDNRVVTFTLPNPLSSFPGSLTTGIVPKHILGQVDPIDLRSVSFNTSNPIGTGPFRWHTIAVNGIADQAETQIGLLPFDHYWAGKPKLTSLAIHAFADQKALITAYKTHQITSLAGLETLPNDLQGKVAGHIYNLRLTAGVYVFFKTSGGVLADAKVRQALVSSANREAIIKQLDFGAQPVDEPVLSSQFAYNTTYRQTDNDLAKAEALLDADGWVVGKNGLRVKDGKTLSFSLSTTDNPEYRKVAALLVAQWRALGVGVQVPAPTAEFQQAVLSPHLYDAVLYGISIGADPDVFVYWDSSQNDVRSATRLNLSEYHSGTADVALEAGRTRLDQELRAVKYKSFLQAWQEDAPALGLYQPRFLYISHDQIYGLSERTPINTDADRFRNVNNWMLNLGWSTPN